MMNGKEKIAGHIISQRRQELGMTQAELAALAGVSVTRISEYECGRRAIGSASVITGIKLADALQMDIRDLIGDYDA